MKNKMNFFICLLTLFTLVSCGGSGNSKAKLEISRGFAVSNAGFDGGLIITGKNSTTGESFSIDLVSGNQSQMELPKGSWTFLAVGWDGDSSALKFGGKPYCGKTDAVLNSDSQTVSISLTIERCASDQTFASSTYTAMSAAGELTATPVLAFKKLNRIISCNSFYNHFNPILPTTQISTVLYTKNSSSIPDNFCSSAMNMPLDLQSKVKAYKFHAFNKTVTQSVGSPGFSSPCLDLTVADGYYPSAAAYPTGLRLPSKLPLMVETFEDSSCSKSIAIFAYSAGLEGDNSEAFDSIFYSILSPNVSGLILPANDVKRAISPFVHLLPKIKCAAGLNCPVEPLIVGGYTYKGYDGALNKIHDRDRSVCPSIGSVTSVPAGITSVGCIPDNGGITLSYAFNSPNQLVSIYFGGVLVYKTYIKPTLTTLESDRLIIRNRLLELHGYQTTTFPRTFFNDGYRKDDDKEMEGVLGSVREMMNTPSAIIGVSNSSLSFKDSCLATSGTKEISLYDDESLSLETYRIEIDNPANSVARGYFCQASNPSVADGSCAKNFEKELRIFDYKTSSLIPRIRTKLNCDEAFGKFLSFDDETKLNSRRTEQNLVSWNTDLSATARFEKISIQQDFNVVSGTSSLKSERREMVRLQKISFDDYALWDYLFQTHKDAAIWNQSMHRLQMTTGSAGTYVSYHLDPLTTSSSTYNLLLTSGAYATNLAATTLPVQASTNGFSLIIDWATLQPNTGTSPHTSINSINNQMNGNIPFLLNSLNSLTPVFQ